MSRDGHFMIQVTTSSNLHRPVRRHSLYQKAKSTEIQLRFVSLGEANRVEDESVRPHRLIHRVLSGGTPPRMASG